MSKKTRKSHIAASIDVALSLTEGVPVVFLCGKSKVLNAKKMDKRLSKNPERCKQCNKVVKAYVAAGKSNDPTDFKTAAELIEAGEQAAKELFPLAG